MAETVSQPAEVFAPGEYVRDELEERGWTQQDLAEILGRPAQLVNDVVLGKRSITPETARGLGQAFGTSPQLWLNLDSAWQLYRTRNDSRDSGISRRARLYSAAPIKEMVRRGWIEFSSNPEILETNVLRFLSVDDLGDVPAVIPAAARMATSYDAFLPAQWAWICRARQLGRAVSIHSTFKPQNSGQLINSFRRMLLHPEEVRHVPRVLGEAGIRLVVVEHLPQTKIDGACLWLEDKSPVIALSLRYDRIDYFWFTLMHEIRHAINRDGLTNPSIALDVDLIGPAGPRDDRPQAERDADEFAQSNLVNQDALDDFVLRKGPLFSELAIRGFANVQSVHPGIVVGQLQHRGDVTYSKFRNLLVKVRSYATDAALTDGWGFAPPALY